VPFGTDWLPIAVHASPLAWWGAPLCPSVLNYKFGFNYLDGLRNLVGKEKEREGNEREREV